MLKIVENLASLFLAFVSVYFPFINFIKCFGYLYLNACVTKRTLTIVRMHIVNQGRSTLQKKSHPISLNKQAQTRRITTYDESVGFHFGSECWGQFYQPIGANCKCASAWSLTQKMPLKFHQQN